MKVAIVTHCKCDNYGAELQSYAMQHNLSSLGLNAEVLDVDHPRKDISKSLNTILPSIKNRFKVYGIKAPIKIIQLALNVRERKRSMVQYKDEVEIRRNLFQKFYTDNQKIYSKLYPLEDLYKKAPDYDAYVAGSDQIWNYMHTDNLGFYFLDFVKDNQVKKISYAASICVPDIPVHLRGEYRRYFESFDAISVREIQAKSLVEKYSDMKAEVVLDPTLLMLPNEWDKLIANKLVKDEDYIFVYSLSGLRNIYKVAKRIAEAKGIKRIIVVKGDYIDLKDKALECRYDVGPREWVGLLANAAYVVTDSFHGTAFSINYNKPFTTVLNPSSNMNSRVLSILSITHLESRCIYDNKIDVESQMKNINYERVNKIIDEKRGKSWRYLKENLLDDDSLS